MVIRNIYMVSYVVSHNISVKHSVYMKLKRIKRENESFSDVIERMFNEGEKGTFSRLKRHFHIDGSLSESDDDLKNIMQKTRKQFNEDLEKTTKKTSEILQ